MRRRAMLRPPNAESLIDEVTALARSRNIKPDFFIDENLTELPIAARLLFAGLWCLADREGRLKDSPKKIKIQVLPFDDVDVNALLDSLNGHFITRYTVDNCAYIQVNNFKKHQNPHKNEKESTIPAPCKHDASTDKIANEHQPSTEQEPEQDSTAPADSLNTDSLNMIDITGGGGNAPAREESTCDSDDVPADIRNADVEATISLFRELHGEHHFTVPTGKEIGDYVESMGSKLVKYALQQTATDKGKTAWEYTRAKLDRWRGSGITTVQMALDDKAQFDEAKARALPRMPRASPQSTADQFAALAQKYAQEDAKNANV